MANRYITLWQAETPYKFANHQQTASDQQTIYNLLKSMQGKLYPVGSKRQSSLEISQVSPLNNLVNFPAPVAKAKNLQGSYCEIVLNWGNDGEYESSLTPVQNPTNSNSQALARISIGANHQLRKYRILAVFRMSDNKLSLAVERYGVQHPTQNFCSLLENTINSRPKQSTKISLIPERIYDIHQLIVGLQGYQPTQIVGTIPRSVNGFSKSSQTKTMRVSSGLSQQEKDSIIKELNKLRNSNSSNLASLVKGLGSMLSYWDSTSNSQRNLTAEKIVFKNSSTDASKTVDINSIGNIVDMHVDPAWSDSDYFKNCSILLDLI